MEIDSRPKLVLRYRLKNDEIWDDQNADEQAKIILGLIGKELPMFKMMMMMMMMTNSYHSITLTNFYSLNLCYFFHIILKIL
jgi:hypothetical protein